MATLLVQNGTLQAGDIVVAGTSHGKLRALSDYHGKPVKKAGPPRRWPCMGLNDVPSAGDMFQVVETEQEARDDRVRTRSMQPRIASRRKKVSLEDLFANFKAGEAKELNLIVKADVQGSLEPICHELQKLGKGEIGINILYAETGNIGENDVMLASASQAIIIGFNVQADVAARRLAEKEGVSIRLYEIIYRMTEDIEKALKRYARAGDRGEGARAGAGAGGLPGFQAGQGGRLQGDRRRTAPQCPHPPLSRRRYVI